MTYKNEQACDVCGNSPARVSPQQGNFTKVFYCKNHNAKN